MTTPCIDATERLDGLLGCPFCGGEATVWPDEVGSGGQWVPPYHAGCSMQRPGQPFGCGFSFTGDDAAEAITAWNRRAESAALRARVDELEGALRWSVGAAINSLVADGRLPEWSEGSGIGVGLRALGSSSLSLDDDARAALEGSEP